VAQDRVVITRHNMPKAVMISIESTWPEGIYRRVWLRPFPVQRALPV